jgi:hypothetical protein
MMYIIYGLDTKSIEDAKQCVLCEVPDDLDADETAEWLADNGEYGFPIANIIKLANTLVRGLDSENPRAGYTWEKE